MSVTEGRLNPVDQAVISQALLSAAREMGIKLYRSAYSPIVRDGKDVAIRPGTGDETGFKYLAGKQDCLILIPGQEGYCR